MSDVNGIDYAQKLSQNRDGYQRALKNVKESYGRDSKNMEENQKIALEKNRENFTEGRSKIEAEHRDVVDQVSKDNTDTIRDSKDKFQQDLVAINNKFNRDSHKQRDYYDQTISDLKKSFDRWRGLEKNHRMLNEQQMHDRTVDKIEHIDGKAKKTVKNYGENAHREVEESKRDFLDKRNVILEDSLDKVHALKDENSMREIKKATSHEKHMKDQDQMYMDRLRDTDLHNDRKSSLMQKTAQDNIVNIENQHQVLNDEFMERNRRDMDRVQADGQQRVQEKEAKNNHDMANMQQKILFARSRNSDKDVKEQQAHHERDLDRKMQQNRHQMQDYTKNLQNELQNAKDGYGNEIEKQRFDQLQDDSQNSQNASVKLNEQMSTSRRERDLMRQTFDTRISGDENRFKERLQYVKERDEEEREQGEKNQEDKMQRFANKTDAQHRLLVGNYTLAKNSEERSHHRQLTNMGEEYARRRDDEMTRFRDTVNYLVNEKNETMKLLKEHFSENQQLVIHRYEDLQSAMMDQIKDEFNRKLETQDTVYRENMSLMQEQFKRMEVNYQDRIVAMEKRFKDETRYKDQVAQDIFHQNGQDSREAIDNQMRSYKNQVDAIHTNYDQRFLEVRQGLGRKLVEVIRDYDGRLQRQEADHTRGNMVRENIRKREAEGLIEGARVEKEQVIKKFEQQLSDMRTQYEAKINELKARQS